MSSLRICMVLVSCFVAMVATEVSAQTSTVEGEIDSWECVLPSTVPAPPESAIGSQPPPALGCPRIFKIGRNPQRDNYACPDTHVRWSNDQWRRMKMRSKKPAFLDGCLAPGTEVCLACDFGGNAELLDRVLMETGKTSVELAVGHNVVEECGNDCKDESPPFPRPRLAFKYKKLATPAPPVAVTPPPAEQPRPPVTRAPVPQPVPDRNWRAVASVFAFQGGDGLISWDIIDPSIRTKGGESFGVGGGITNDVLTFQGLVEKSTKPDAEWVIPIMYPPTTEPSVERDDLSFGLLVSIEPFYAPVVFSAGVLQGRDAIVGYNFEGPSQLLEGPAFSAKESLRYIAGVGWRFDTVTIHAFGMFVRTKVAVQREWRYQPVTNLNSDFDGTTIGVGVTKKF